MPHSCVRQLVGQSDPLLIRQPLAALRRLHELPLGNLGIATHQDVAPLPPARLLLRIAQSHPPSWHIPSGYVTIAGTTPSAEPVLELEREIFCAGEEKGVGPNRFQN